MTDTATEATPTSLEACRHPLIGVGAVVIKNGRLLLGRRAGAHGAGTWSIPGGHLEYLESLFACAAREVLEETGVAVRGVAHLDFTEDIMRRDNKHYLTHFIKCMYVSGDGQVTEASKFQDVRWVSSDQLWQLFSRGELFSPLSQLLGREFNLFA